MRIVNSEQGTKEWKELRKRYITATDYCAAFATTPLFKGVNRKSVIDKKLGKLKERFTNAAMMLGSQLEPVIHKLTQEELDTPLEHGKVIIANNGFCLASLDAVTPNYKCVVEYKTTSKAMSDEAKLVEYYKKQVVHQIYCTEADLGVLVIAYLNEDKTINHLSYITINPEEEESREEWEENCRELLSEIDALRNPPKEILTINDELRNLLTEKHAIEDRIKELRDSIESQHITQLPDFNITYATINKYDYNAAYEALKDQIIDPVIDTKGSVQRYLKESKSEQLLEEFKTGSTQCLKINMR